MPENIFSQDYWRERLDACSHDQLHRSVFLCNERKWKEIEESHKRILNSTVYPMESVLDIGCGWGRLLDLMPPVWFGGYLGLDLSPDFVRMADERFPSRRFWVHDIRDLDLDLLTRLIRGRRFDWCILISIRAMIVRNAGQEVWDGIEKQLREVSRRLLFLEYDVKDQGTVVEC